MTEKKLRIDERKDSCGELHLGTTMPTQTRPPRLRGEENFQRRGTTEERKALGGDSGPATAVSGE